MNKELLDYIFQREDDGRVGILDLPKECIYEILFKLSDHKDIVHFGKLICSGF